jgi:hypothetical protein
MIFFNDDSLAAKDRESDFANAKALLSELIRVSELAAVLEEEGCLHASRVYTQAPTLWLLVLQRLGGGLSLQAAVEELITHHTDILPRNRRVEEGTLSENNSAYNQARRQLPLSVVEKFSHCLCDYLARHCEPVWFDRRVFIIDGTTVTLPPTAELKKAFPPATNQRGESVWPVAMLMVASELSTGCVLVPQIDPMYGENNSSEARQAVAVIQRLPADALVLADIAFGIFSVAYHCDQSQRKFVFRLATHRFNALRRKATLVHEGSGVRTWQLTWQPSVKDRLTNKDFPLDAAVNVWLHEIELENGTSLYLVSNVEADARSAASLYLKRYDVEFDIRDLKVTMDTENIRAKHLDTVFKELLGSIIAYNLVAQFRRQAAKLARVEPRRLSFTGVWTVFRHRLLYQRFESLQDWRLAYLHALAGAAKHRHPNRSRPRNYPRVAHPRRPKTTKFQKSLRKKKPPDPPD